ncbi:MULTISPECIES: ATP-binding cassette domain-containing protein [unclassified Guyparkeria]|uniref:ABC transporter ATP-binding protein n=1 Tax=unclassified Guyparkeria TaxID=2626246 RepID=UPI0007333C11|nr:MULTISPECIES: ATP-binding cassette domain-containing protein [unclassified Guyparkeria]KTG17694.1 iron-hydroxamate transporter ATP-binding subunit [Guyparkeria sp. XI15]OAE88507.1 iron-hydroxamate transporter ATP-binding subunit [Guyparkeria sp. WRN-7]
MFELDGVTFSINRKTLLEPVDLCLEPGRVYGLVGHNGSGKSTLVNLLARQTTPSGGSLQFEGRPLDDWSSRGFARRVAYLPQHPPAAGHLTGRELVGFGRYPWHGLLGRFAAADRRQVEHAMAMTQTAVFADRRVETLSGGERQRVWLAMLLAQESDFLLLDEPLSALDIAHQVEMLALIRRLSHELDLSVVIVLHDINMAARYCDELVAMHSGRLLVRGTPEELMDSATLRSIYGVSMQVITPPGQLRPVAIVD